MPQGYNDWQRIDQQAGDAIYATTTLKANTATEQGPFYVGNWEKLSVYAAVNRARNGDLDFTVRFYVDQAKTLLVASMSWETYTNLPIIDQLACVGQWVTFQFVATNVTTSDTMTITLAPFMSPGINARQFGTSGFLAISQQTIAPGASTQGQATYVTQGLFSISSHVNQAGAAPNADVQVFGQNSSGVVRVVYGVVLKNAVVNDYKTDLVYLPGLWLTVQVTNRSAANELVDVSIVQAA